MPDAKTTAAMSPGLQEVAERAKRDPDGRFHGLAHLLDVPALERAYRRLRKAAAVGVDGITVEQYGEKLQSNLQDLHERLKAKRYRHQPIRRVHIPKEQGKTRPIGISTVEDKVVQGALRDVLEAIYEQDFLDCSYGFRPGRSAHDAIRALYRQVDRGVVKYVLEADIRAFFDSLDRDRLKEMLQRRVADGTVGRLVGKCLHVGVLDGEAYSEPEEGTAQGSVISPLLGNLYLHYVLDEWFEGQVKPRLAGEAHLIRYADDFIITFERRDDAERVLAVLHRRMNKYGLTLHPDKTRLVAFGRPARSSPGAKGPATFDFLGFTLFWRRARSGAWVLGCKTRSARIGRFLNTVADWCRSHRHEPVKEQHEALKRRMQGHFNYYGVNGNLRCLEGVLYAVKRLWHKWLCRRSQRAYIPWERFADLLRDLPLPAPRIVVQIWAR